MRYPGSLSRGAVRFSTLSIIAGIVFLGAAALLSIIHNAGPKTPQAAVALPPPSSAPATPTPESPSPTATPVKFNGDAMMTVGEAQFADHDYTAVVSTMDTILAHVPDHKAALELKQRAVQLLAKKPQEASHAAPPEQPQPTGLPEVAPTKVDPAQVMPLLEGARTALKEQNFDLALDFIKRLQLMDSQNSELRGLKKDYDRGLALQKEELNRSKKQAEQADKLYKKAQSLFEKGDLKECIASINRVLELDPAHQGALELLRTIQEQQVQKTLPLEQVAELNRMMEQQQWSIASSRVKELLTQYPTEQALLNIKERAEKETQRAVVKPPVLDSPELSVIAPGKPFTVSIKVTADKDISGVVLFYRNSKEKSFKQMPMTLAGAAYQAEISGNQIERPGIDFYVVAADTSGIAGHYPLDKDFKSISVQERSAPRIKGL